MNKSPGLWALEQTGLTSTEKHVLTALAVRADNKTWQCFPGVKTLMADTRYSRKTVIKTTRSLSDKQKIQIKRRQRLSNLYTLLPGFDIPTDGTTEDGLEVVPEGTTKNNLDVPSGDLDVPPQSSCCPTRSPLTISNYKNSNSKKGVNSESSQNRKTRNRSLGEDLSDISWAETNVSHGTL